jgi:YbbR domain-containing protein
MLNLLRNTIKMIPTLILAMILAVAVWISAVTADDPNVEKTYPRSVPLEVIGQEPGLIMTSQLPSAITVVLRAPRSIWDQMSSEDGLVKAVVDISGQGTGTHSIKVQIHLGLRPVRVITVSPSTINITLETVTTRTLPIILEVTGVPEIGFQALDAVMTPGEVTISGPDSLIQRVAEIAAALDITQANTDIHKIINLQALDAAKSAVTGIAIEPNTASVTIPLVQRGGYRNVVVKVVLAGQVASGYRLTTISAYPPAVTLFSSDPTAIDQLPSYVETMPINLSGAKDDLDLQVVLNLPYSITLVGGQPVNVHIGVAAIESSITLSNMRVQVQGLTAGLTASTSPEKVDIILSGPLNLIDNLLVSQVHVVVDLRDKGPGTYQIVPTVNIDEKDLKVESILPGSIQVTISESTPTPTITPTVTTTPTVTPTKRVR